VFGGTEFQFGSYQSSFIFEYLKEHIYKRKLHNYQVYKFIHTKLTNKANVTIYDTNKIFFNPGKGMKDVLGNIDLPFRMLALKIDYKKSKRGYT
jgi:hypothetical protein